MTTTSQSSNSEEQTFGQRFGRLDLGQVDLEEGGGPAEAPIVPARPGEPGRDARVSRAGTSSLGSWLSESFVGSAMYLLACLCAALGVLVGLYQLTRSAKTGVGAADALMVAGWIVGGLALAGGLIGVASLLGALVRLRRQLREQASELGQLSERLERLGHLAVDPQMLDRLEDRLGRLDEAVTEVAHNSLLDEVGRAEKRQQLTVRERERAIEQIRYEMAEGQWDRARHGIERLRAGFPGQADSLNKLAEELEHRREQAEAEDIAAARRQLDELMSISAWDRAISAAQELVQKHPDATGAKSLLARVDRERKIADDQQRQTLYAQIQACTSRRRWSDALQAAGRLIDLFPNSIEAEAVKVQLDTLAANAEIQHRQKVEVAIKDMVRRQRFDEAVAMAVELIQEYPNSPQAQALTRQLPRLKERAEQARDELKKRRVQWKQ